MTDMTPREAVEVLREVVDFEERHAEYEPRANHQAREALATLATLSALADRAGEADLLAALRIINTHHNLGDAIYSVRERVYDDDPDYDGNSWEHPNVVAYSDAVGVVQKALDDAFPPAAPGASHE